MYKDEENFIHLYFFNGLTDDNIPIYKDIDLSSIPFSYTCIENGMYWKDYKFDNKSIIKINCTLVANNNNNSIEYKELKLKNNKDYVTLEDKKRKLKIKIRFDYNNFTHFFNQNCLCLIDEIDTLKSIGLDTIALDCRFSSEKYVSKIISLYIQAINKEAEGETLKETISSISQSPLDNGNFIDGRRLEDKNY